MRRRFVTLDVFTDKRFAGNPLAVVLEPDGLDTAAMQTIAREFNLSETVFVLPPAERGAPREAAHLHAGARTAVRRPSDGRHGGAARATRRRHAAARLRARTASAGALQGDAAGGRRPRGFDLPRLPEDIGAPADDDDIAAALGIADEIGFDGCGRRAGRRGALYLRAGARSRCGRALRRQQRRVEKAFGFEARGGLRVLPRDRASRDMLPRPHVRAERRHHRGSGDRFGGRGVRGHHRAGSTSSATAVIRW